MTRQSQPIGNRCYWNLETGVGRHVHKEFTPPQSAINQVTTFYVFYTHGYITPMHAMQQPRDM